MKEMPIISFNKVNLIYDQNIINKMNIFKRKVNQNINGIHNCSFSIMKGDTIGIIGENGAGKSTLLRLIAKTLLPDNGSIEINTKSVSLLSLGVGFRLDLSGRDNLILNALLLGIKKKEIDEIINEIIEYSEISEFIDQPVRTYSSGMRSKLAFSISIKLKPEILLIDEILSVGDESFKYKSRKEIENMIAEERTTIIVSHNLELIRRHCNSVILLDKGHLISFGETEDIINKYIEKNKKDEL